MTTFTATPDPALREPFEVGQVQWLRKPGEVTARASWPASGT